MAVTLRMTGGGLSGANATKVLSQGTLSIGRGAGNDWVLPDPERHLSKTHCVLSIEHGRVILTDLSTNGVHINGATQATARDSRTVLTDGDTFRVGKFTVTVAEATGAGSGAGSGGRYSGAIVEDPFDTPAGPAEGGDPLDIDPLDDPLGRPPDPAFHHHLQHRASGPARSDPFDVAEERSHQVAEPDDDLFRGTKPTQEWQGPTQADNADAPKQAWRAPNVLPTPMDPNAIDFDALIGDLGPAAPPPPRAAPPPPQAPQAPAQPRYRDPLADAGDLLATSPHHPPPVPPPPTPQRSAALLDDPFAEPEPPPPPAPRPAPTPQAPPPTAERPPPPAYAPAPVAPTPQPAPRPPPSAAEGASGDARAVLLAFLEGAGVNTPTLATADPEATLRLVGQVFRAMTAGLREVLLSRAAIKSDMRIEQTMIRASDNNGLKFSVNVDDAVAALLMAQRPGYMAPLAATKEAFHDIKAHELAVMAGVQTALMNLLTRFNPETLEARLSTGRLASVLPGARKARYWDSFTEVYGEIARESEDDFQAVFGRSFAKAYAAQSKKE